MITTNTATTTTPPPPSPKPTPSGSHHFIILRQIGHLAGCIKPTPDVFCSSLEMQSRQNWRGCKPAHVTGHVTGHGTSQFTSQIPSRIAPQNHVTFHCTHHVTRQPLSCSPPLAARIPISRYRNNIVYYINFEYSFHFCIYK